jgi:hypothetical protein
MKGRRRRKSGMRVCQCAVAQIIGKAEGGDMCCEEEEHRDWGTAISVNLSLQVEFYRHTIVLPLS